MEHVTSRELELLLDSYKRIILAKDPPLNLIELLMLVIHKKARILKGQVVLANLGFTYKTFRIDPH